MRKNLARLAVLPLALSMVPAVHARPRDNAALVAEIRRLAAPTGGTVGVAVRELGASETTSVNGDMLFPMANLFQVALAGTLLGKVDRGEISLDRMIAVPEAARVESDIIADRLLYPGISLSIANLVGLMLAEGDNTATDLLFDLAGGGSGITAWLRDRGITGQRVDRNINAIIRDYLGVAHGGPYLDAMRVAVKRDPDLTRRATIANAAFERDPRDQATPVSLVDLLDRIASGRALSPASTEFILSALRRSGRQQGLAGLMPAGTVLAHRSSALGGNQNDVGLVDLPDGRKLVVSILLKDSSASIEVRERAIADIGRTIRDHYVTGGSDR